jgi:2-(1,2-epoxy-1,2-dihydrophenyl)acetyl-CoA isomerase
VYSDAELMDETLAFAKRLGDGPPIQQREIKKLMYQSMRTDLRTSLELVSSHMAVVQSTADYKEALPPSRKKGSPSFREINRYDLP